VRPAYFGTYRKRSATVRPRRPFTEDDQLDYEEDSADEWEEEEPGENIESGDEVSVCCKYLVKLLDCLGVRNPRGPKCRQSVLLCLECGSLTTYANVAYRQCESQT